MDSASVAPATVRRGVEARAVSTSSAQTTATGTAPACMACASATRAGRAPRAARRHAASAASMGGARGACAPARWGGRAPAARRTPALRPWSWEVRGARAMAAVSVAHATVISIGEVWTALFKP
eukprot:scaffold117510_cov66-Phaeocystis_antarctica.AAC.1